MNTSLSHFEGPRQVQREEALDSLRLSCLCFNIPEIENKESSGNYAPPKRGGTYAFLYEGRPVSQIGIWHDRIKMYDGTIRTGSIGNVCTHPDFRGHGLANRLMAHCAQQMHKEGARLMLISGDRGLYTRMGNVLHGRFVYFSIEPKQGNQGGHRSTDIVIRKAVPADALLFSRLYEAEPVHYIRRKSEFMPALENPIGNIYLHAGAWMIERSGQALAYLFLGVPYGLDPDAGIRHVSEYAGSRLALAEALPSIVETGNLREIHCPVAWQDFELIHLLQKNGYDGKLAPLNGHTLRILNFPGFMKDLRPVLQVRLDNKLLRGLRFEQKGPLLGGTGMDRYTIIRGSERLELDGAAMTYLVMGNADAQAEVVPASGSLAEVIAALFPLPSFLPGLNYR